MKTKTIEIEVFETPDGKPTCASDFRTGKQCKFLLTRKFGTELLCGFTGNDDKLEDYKMDGTGYLKPCESCPLHS